MYLHLFQESDYPYVSDITGVANPANPACVAKMTSLQHQTTYQYLQGKGQVFWITEQSALECAFHKERSHIMPHKLHMLRYCRYCRVLMQDGWAIYVRSTLRVMIHMLKLAMFVFLRIINLIVNSVPILQTVRAIDEGKMF